MGVSEQDRVRRSLIDITEKYNMKKEELFTHLSVSIGVHPRSFMSGELSNNANGKKGGSVVSTHTYKFHEDEDICHTCCLSNSPHPHHGQAYALPSAPPHLSIPIPSVLGRHPHFHHILPESEDDLPNQRTYRHPPYPKGTYPASPMHCPRMSDE